MTNIEIVRRKLQELSTLTIRARIDWLNGELGEDALDDFLMRLSDILYLMSTKLESEGDGDGA